MTLPGLGIAFSQRMLHVHLSRFSVGWLGKLCLIWLAASPRYGALGINITVTDGQALADAVGAWGASVNSTTDLFLDTPYISVRNATFSNTAVNNSLPLTWSSGRLTLYGRPVQDPAARTVLDTGSRVGLVPTLRETARLQVANLNFINLCEVMSPVNSKGTRLLAAGYLALFIRSRVYQAEVFDNVTLYVRPSEVSMTLYAGIVQGTKHFNIISQLTSHLLEDLPSLDYTITRVTPVSLNLGLLNHPTLLGRNMELRSIFDPSDPVIRSLRAAGKLMTPRFCINQYELTQAQITQDVDPFTGPLWIVEDIASLQNALSRAADISRLQSSTATGIAALPPIVFLAASVLMPNLSTLGPTALSGPAMITGLAADAPDQRITLDMTQQSGVFELRPQGQLFIKMLTLTGLKPRSAPGQAAASVFPLAAVSLSNQTATRVGAPVWMHQGTLVLPLPDYLALLLLATSSTPDSIASCVDEPTRQLAAQLQADITQLTPGTVGPGRGWLDVDTFQGWGIQATQLHLAPPADAVVLPGCQPATSTSSSRQCGTGCVVGVAVGASIASVALISIAMWWLKRSSQPCLPRTAAKHVSSKEADLVGKPSIASAIGTSAELQAWPISSADTPSMSALHQAVLAAHNETMSSYINRATPTTCSSSSTLLVNPVAAVQQLAGNLNEEDANKILVSGVLGRGSWGIVYKGEWRGLPVAIKTLVFQAEHGVTIESLSKHKAIVEAAIAGSLSHPNVVATYKVDIQQMSSDANNGTGLQIEMAIPHEMTDQAGHSEFKMYLVQELCSTALTAPIKDKCFTPEDATTDWLACCTVLLDIAAGLDYLHSKGIIHGDLKPDNVLLQVQSGSTATVIAKLAVGGCACPAELLRADTIGIINHSQRYVWFMLMLMQDFGLSAHLPGDATHVSNYNSGTPFYVAPEVVNERRTSPASDMYSFGVIAWQMCTGLNPWVQNARGHAVFNPLLTAQAYPHHQPPAGYRALIARCLETLPSDRPTAREAIDELLELSRSPTPK